MPLIPNIKRNVEKHPYTRVEDEVKEEAA